MLGFTPPYHSLQEMNLDWLLTKIKNMLRFLPDDGAVGQILRRTAHGAEWSDEQGGGGAVNSVNGQTGTVVLDKTDIGLGNVDDVQQYSASNPPPYPVTSVNGQTGAVTISGGAVDSVNGQTGTVVLAKSDIGLGNVDNVQQYSASNPPPYPVTSVNGQTGTVTISVPDSTSDLNNDSGFITAAEAPVQSVNGQTGDVVVPSIYIPTYTQLTEIYNHTGIIDTTVTIPSDGWYLIDLIGAWGSTIVYVGTTNIAKAQITTSNVTMSTVGLYLFGAGTVLSIKIQYANGRVIISKTV